MAVPKRRKSRCRIKQRHGSHKRPVVSRATCEKCGAARQPRAMPAMPVSLPVPRVSLVLQTGSEGRHHRPHLDRERAVVRIGGAQQGEARADGK